MTVKRVTRALGGLAALWVLLCAGIASEPGTYLVSPSEGSFDEGLFSSWTTSFVTGGATVAGDNSVQSAFSWSGTGALLLNDADVTSNGPRVAKTFAPLPSGSDFTTRLSDDPTVTAAGPELRLGAGGYLAARNGSGQVQLIPVVQATWYHVQVTVRLGTQTYDVAVQSKAGGVTSSLTTYASSLAFPGAPTNLAAVVVDDASAATAGGSVYVDNITLRAASTVDTKIFNILAYGAKGDGTTNDAAAVVAAQNALLANGSGVLYFPQAPVPTGNYRYATSGNGVSFTGISNVTVLFGTSAILQMDNLTTQVVGGVNSYVGAGHGIYFAGPASNIWVLDAQVKWTVPTGLPYARSFGDGFRFFGYPNAAGATISNIHFRNCRTEQSPQTGAIFLGCSTVDVQDFTIVASLADGCHFNACQSVTVDTVTGNQTGDDTLAFVTYYDPTLIYDQGHYDQPSLTSGWCNANSSATNITSINSKADGVRISQGYNISIANVTASGASNSGIMIDSAVANGSTINWTYLASQLITVQNVNLSGCGTGFYVWNNSTNAPPATDSRWWAFDVSLDGSSISSNTISGCITDSIHVQLAGAATIGAGVRINNVTASGRQVRLENSIYCSVTNMALSGAGLTAVGVASVAADLSNLPVTELTLDQIAISGGGSILIQNHKGVSIGSLNVTDANTDGVNFTRVVQTAGHPNITAINVTRPNRSASTGAVRGLLFSKSQGLKVNNYTLVQDANAIRSLELGGGDASAVTQSILISQMNYTTGIAPLANAVVIQGGSFAPVSCSVSEYFQNSAGTIRGTTVIASPNADTITTSSTFLSVATNSQVSNSGAFSPNGVAIVSLKEGGTTVGSLVRNNTNGTWSWSWTPSVTGRHTLTLTAQDSSGNAAVTTFDVMVSNSPAEARLSSLSLSQGMLSPSFSPSVGSYGATITNSISSLTVTPVTVEPLATVTVNGVVVASGNASSSVALNVGANVINTSVVAPDGVTTQNYQITVTRQSAVESWRQMFFGNSANTGDAANSADPYGRGLPNLVTFALLGPSQNPATAIVGLLPRPQLNGGNLIYSFTEPVGISDVTYGAEWRTDLASGIWTSIPDTGSGTTHIFSVPAGGSAKLFIRLTITSP
jgi:hypothetical protein